MGPRLSNMFLEYSILDLESKSWDLIRFSFLQKPFGLEVKVWEGMGRLEKRLDCWRGSESGILDIRSLSTKLFSK